MKTLADIQKNYSEKELDIETLRKRLYEREQQAMRLQNRISKKIDNSWWGDLLIRPVMELVKERTPHLTWTVDRLVPTGLRNNVWVFAKDKNNKTVSLTFTPPIEDGKLRYDFRMKNHPRCNHGFNYECKEIESIDELVEFLDKKMQDNLQD